MNPYHIIGIIAVSTLIYAGLVSILVLFGIPLIGAMALVYAGMFSSMLSMQRRASQEFAVRQQRRAQGLAFAMPVMNSNFGSELSGASADHSQWLGFESPATGELIFGAESNPGYADAAANSQDGLLPEGRKTGAGFSFVSFSSALTTRQGQYSTQAGNDSLLDEYGIQYSGYLKP